MKLDSIRDLKRLIALCRKEGIEQIKLEGLELTFGSLPEPKVKTSPKTVAPLATIVTEETPIHPLDGLTEEQLLMWSVGADAETN